MKKWIFVSFVLFLAAFLRFYRLPDLFIFGGDEEYQSLLAQTIVNNFHIIWTGVTAGHFGFYLGPFWTYFTSFWLFLSKGDPQITGYVSATIGILTTGLIIYTGNKLFGRRVGIFSGLLYATLPLFVYFDQKYWNPTLVPMISVGMLLCLSNLHKNPKWWILFFILFGFIFHVHLSLLPFGVIALILFIKEKIYKKLSKYFFVGLFIFFIIYSPLLLFDYFHKGSNITTPLRFKEYSSAPSVRINPQRHFEVLFQSIGRVWYINKNSSNADNVLYACSPFAYLDNTSDLAKKISTRTTPNFLTSFVSLIFIILFIFSAFRSNNFTYKILASSILVIACAYLFLPVATHEYYLLGIFPLILFILPILINTLNEKKLLIIILLISFFGVHSTLSTKDDFGYTHKVKIIEQIKKAVGDKQIEIDQIGLCHHYGGWRYLLKHAGKTPLRSTTDEGLGWLYEEEISKQKADYKIIFHEARYPIDDKFEKSQTISEGGFRVYLIENK